MNNQTYYWIWIQQTIGYNSKRIKDILKKYTFAEDFYRAALNEKLKCSSFSKREAEALKDLSMESVVSILSTCSKNGVEVVSIGDVDYPSQLLEIEAPPTVLYVLGDKRAVTNKKAIAMVGTRNPTPYGKETALQLSSELAKNGYTIVSGGAAGIDTFSHQGAVTSGGKTVCVLGVGVLRDFMKNYPNTKKRILDSGAVISEFPPLMPGARHTFPIRNRIISGLSKGVIVVEAGLRSGSLITSNIAKNQNRPVFAVPGNINSEVSIGTNNLIKKGAFLVTGVGDILGYYKNDYLPNRKNDDDLRISDEHIAPKNQNKNFDKRSVPNDDFAPMRQSAAGISEKKQPLPKLTYEQAQRLSDTEKKILSAFDSEIIHIDKIIQKTQLSVNKVQSAITMLEMGGYLKSLEGRFYRVLYDCKF